MGDQIQLTEEDVTTLQEGGAVDLGHGVELVVGESFKSYVDNLLDKGKHSVVPRDEVEKSTDDKVKAKFYQMVPFTLHNELVEDDNVRVGDIYWKPIDGGDEHSENEAHIVVELFDER